MHHKLRVFFTINLLIALLATTGHGQNSKRNVRDIIMTGNEFYFNDQFSKASDLYYSAIQVDSTNLYANYYLAECKRKLFDFKEAEKYYKKAALKEKGDFPLARYYYPLMQKLNGKFKDAINNFELFVDYSEERRFEGHQEDIQKALIEIKGCYFAISHLENPFGEYNFKNLPEPVNTEYNDYGPAILNNDSAIVISSGRKTATGHTMNNRYGEYFADNFRFHKDSLGWVFIPDEDGFKNTNTELEEGAGSYTHTLAEDAFYFTGCYEDGPFCKIYVSVKKDGKWQAPEAVEAPINLKGSDNKQPSITAGGDTLFFVSNRAGGFGGNDVWMSVQQDGKWGDPINLGESINTAFSEIAPSYYQTDNILFFASDGHEGLGGLDIFMAKGGIADIKSVENLGYPFNSNHDDGYLILGDKKGYLASNRQGGAGNFDVYQFDIVTQQSIIADVDQRIEREEKILRSRVLDRSGAEVYVLREEDEFYYDNLESEEKAVVDRIIAAKLEAMLMSKDLKLTLEEQTYLDTASEIEKSRIHRLVQLLYLEGKDDLEKYIKSIPPRESAYTYLTISGKLFEKETDAPAAHIDIPLIDEEGSTIKTTTTNEDGTFRYINLPRNRKYRILAENTPKKLTESARFYVKDIQYREETKRLVSVQLEDIYFDPDKSLLRPEARKVLDDLIVFYRGNPEIQVEIYAYTDEIGSDQYNYSLSAERGKAAYNYLIAHGVDRTALVMEAQGKDNTLQSSHVQINRQLKRRVAFTILGASKPFKTNISTYILRRAVTLEELAEKTGQSRREIQELNGASSNTLPAYSPVRLRGYYSKDDDLLFNPEGRSLDISLR